MDKQEIFENIDDYTVEQIVQFIKDNFVSFDELCDTANTQGYFSSKIRKKVQEKLNEVDNSEDDDWNVAVEKNTSKSYLFYLENYPAGKYRDEAKRKKRELEDDEFWQVVLQNDSIQFYKEYLNNYSDGKHVAQAQDKIRKLSKENLSVEDIDFEIDDFIKELRTTKESDITTVIKREYNNKNINEEILYEIIRDDNNLLGISTIKDLINGGIIDYDGLLSKANIKRAFIKALKKDISAIALNATDCKSIDSIKKVSTEIYFWGVSASGKSCAIGAILNAAKKKGYGISNKEGHSVAYFDGLAALFDETDERPTSVLPTGNPCDTLAEMGFDLKGDDGRIHPLTFIDLPGELLEAIYESNHPDYCANPLPSHIKAYETFENLMFNSNNERNRKIHFFIVEYGAAKKVKKNINVIDFLCGVVDSLNDKDLTKNPFYKNTDAIFVLLTKSDKIKEENRNEHAIEYVLNSCNSLIEQLKNVCRLCELNNYSKPIFGKEKQPPKIPIIPFSLGEVCFKTYSLFDDTTAKDVLDVLKTYSTSIDASNSVTGNIKKLTKK
ncbi:MAG: hypothetical protein K5860_10720 [Bacteroidales bacterium]|nr:hypothetical protein [Bacteroidales bacterium]